MFGPIPDTSRNFATKILREQKLARAIQTTLPSTVYTSRAARFTESVPQVKPRNPWKKRGIILAAIAAVCELIVNVFQLFSL